MHCRRPDTALATALIAWRGHHLLESTDLTTNNAPTTPPKNSLAGLPKFAFTPQTDRSVVSSPAALHTPIIKAAADHDGSRPDYRLYEVQNGNHIETYAATFPQLQYVDPHAQNAFDLRSRASKARLRCRPAVHSGGGGIGATPVEPGHCASLLADRAEAIFAEGEHDRVGRRLGCVRAAQAGFSNVKRHLPISVSSPNPRNQERHRFVPPRLPAQPRRVSSLGPRRPARDLAAGGAAD